MNMREILDAGPVMPVIVIDDADLAVPLARALIAGGIRVLEVTLRTEAALEAIRRIAREVPEAIVGAGTVLDAVDAERARTAGARFGVSPGSTPELLSAIKLMNWPFLPGAATASEAMSLANAGYTELKFFPASAAGGVPLLKALGGPLQRLSFCPTGGITQETAPAYLALPNVRCVGGTWLTPTKLMQKRDWTAVEQLARASLALRPG